MELLHAKIVGLGTDLAEVERIHQSVVRFGDRFLQRVFTPAEIAYVSTKANWAERYAARFAAKEAGMKALGTGWAEGVSWQEFEVVNLPSGRPTLRLHGKAADYSVQRGVHHIHLTLTHTASLAMATVILEA